MPRIDDIFAQLRIEGRKAIMPFVTGGYPSLDVTERVIPELERCGAAVVEIGFPFSDPIADGPVIAASMHQTLQTGVTPVMIFDLVKRIRPLTKLGLVAMVSDSIITRMGPERFVSLAADAGFDGLIVPDIDLEAARPLSGLCKASGLAFTLLIAPTTQPDRMAAITRLCSGFIYLLARVGITGETATLDPAALADRITLVRQHSALPIAVGFGISTAEHVRQVTEQAEGGGGADAAIVGSALVRAMGVSPDPVKAAGEFMRAFQTGFAPVP